ncbi:DUF2683 family protein [Candidatus Woesearchaeota archaeon]|nr:DUF2683 family protein [Candidatus Woesearchaeota archaeon]
MEAQLKTNKPRTDLEEKWDRVLNIVKGKFYLKNKSGAITLIIDEHEQAFLEQELRPEFVEEMNKIKKQKAISFKNISDLRKRYEKR